MTYHILFFASNMSVISNGSTPANYTTTVGATYAVDAENYGNCTFSNWPVTDTNAPVSFTPSSADQTLTAVFDCNSRGPTWITVGAHTIPAGYWAGCFATVWVAGTGPGASMFFALSYSNGTLVSSGFSDENGFTFAGLTPGTTYILQSVDCDNCHGSAHDVLFSRSGDGNSTNPIELVAGSAVDAWFNCTNGCGGY